ncbi:MAG: hypothetical protein KKF46_00485 [Nanoarchaeota archaeon]|nr:hypothetical protein [Nanoarchaeota archaeon]MBU1320811.1 hypothetical protein [Nanoarchaeota archaeon]
MKKTNGSNRNRKGKEAVQFFQIKNHLLQGEVIETPNFTCSGLGICSGNNTFIYIYDNIVECTFCHNEESLPANTHIK